MAVKKKEIPPVPKTARRKKLAKERQKDNDPESGKGSEPGPVETGGVMPTKRHR